MNKPASIIKSFFVFLVKTVYIGAFFVMSALLLKMLYFPRTADSSRGEAKTLDMVTEYDRNEKMIDNIFDRKELMSRDHFHMTDEYVFQMESVPPVCLICHGIYPHNKKTKIVSFLNLHVGFMACEICHIRKESNDKNHYFVWADYETGKISMKVKGGFGKYRAKIVPMKIVNGTVGRLDKIISKPFKEMYLQVKGKQYTVGEDQAVVRKVHQRRLSKKAVTCLECHKGSGYMNFSELGFQQKRINQLVSSEVSRMIEHYDTFYMPKMLMLNR